MDLAHGQNKPNELNFSPAGSHGLREHHPSGVNGLEHPLLVDASGDLTDEHGCHALGTQLLVHTEEVDLHHQLLTAHSKAHTQAGISMSTSPSNAIRRGSGQCKSTSELHQHFFVLLTKVAHSKPQ